MKPVDNEPTSAERASHLREQVANAGTQARERLADVARPLENKARGIVDEQQDANADRLSKVGDAVHGAAQTLESDMPQLAGYIHSAAERLQDASNALRTGNVEDLVDRYNNFSRKQPALAFAGAVLAGVALSRFLKSSAPNAQP